MRTCPATSLDLFTDSIRLMGDATMCLVMEFDTKMDIHRLQRAAKACLDAHPVLRSRLVRWKGPAYWEMAEDLTIAIEVLETDGSYNHLAVNPVSPYDFGQVKLRLVRRRSGDIIIVSMAHAAADAYGLVIFCQQLLAEYMEPGMLHAADDFPERDTLWTAALVKGIVAEGSHVKVLNPMWPDCLGTSDAMSGFHAREIGRDDVARIKRTANGMGGTLNDALLAAYFATMSDLTGVNGPINVFFPVNLRQHLRDCSRGMSNQSANVGFPLQRGPEEGLMEILPKVIASTRAMKEGGIGIREQAEMDKASDAEGMRVHDMVRKMLEMERHGMADIFLSNPGPVELPEAKGLQRAFICYPGALMPTDCFAVSTFRGRMTITLGFQDDPRPRNASASALEAIVSYLLSIRT